MRREHVALLRCPSTSEKLSLDVVEEAQDGHVLSGTLRSSAGSYPIEDGVPRFIMDEQTDSESETVEAFGEQWTNAGHFSWTYGQDEEYFRQYFHPLEPTSFRGRVVLDAGCGNGRLVEFALRYHPDVVVGLDYSRSVDIAFRRTREAANVLVVQGSLLQPPLEVGRFDTVFSLGVVHHLADPVTGVGKVGELLRDGGQMHLWTYSYEGNELYLLLLRPLRSMARRLPRGALWGLSNIIAVVGWPYLLMASWLARRFPGRHVVPMSEYLAFLQPLGFRVFALVVHDQLTPAIARYPRRSDLLEWCEHPCLEISNLEMRSGNSWRVGLVKKGGLR